MVTALNDTALRPIPPRAWQKLVKAYAMPTVRRADRDE